MNKYATWGLLMVLTVAVGISGCSKSKGKDETFVRQVLTALYAGNVEGIRAQCFAPDVINDRMAKLAPEVNQRYGAVKSLKHNGTLQEQYGTTQEAWIVTCERGSFRLQLMMTRDEELNGLWVDPVQ